jgi:hypothetical protein
MKAIWSTLAIVLAISAGAFSASPAQAAIVNLNTSNALGTNPAGVDFLFVTVSDGLAGAVDFRVEINPALNTTGAPDLGIQAFSFNFGELGVTADNLVLPDGWSVMGFNQPHSNFGSFDLQIHGTGNSRQDPLLFSIKDITGDSVTDYVSLFSRGGQQDSLFAAHVPGLDVTGSGGVHFGGTSVVPVPAAVWLMLSALALLVIRARAKVPAKVNQMPAKVSRVPAKVRQGSREGFVAMGMLPWGWQAADGL